MTSSKFGFVAVGLVALTTLLTACVQPPTQKQGVVDLHASVSFKINEMDAGMPEARVLVDRLDSGRAGDFIEGKAALRLLPGTHQIQVIKGSQLVFDERTYVGEGVTRSFVLK